MVLGVDCVDKLTSPRGPILGARVELPDSPPRSRKSKQQQQQQEYLNMMSFSNKSSLSPWQLNHSARYHLRMVL